MPITLSWSFLTVVPAPWVEARPRAIAASTALFPVVGIALGGALGALGLGLDRVLPAAPVAVAVLAAYALITGGIHLDGAMDTADGVFGGQTVERRLEILRDSRIGAFGAIAGALALLGQYACLSELTGLVRLDALLTALTLGRWSMTIAIAAFPSARSTGLGATFQRAGGRWPVVIASIVALGVGLAAFPFGVVAFIATALVTLLGGHFLSRRLGGLTGDTYGALAVVVETIVLYLAVAFRG